MKNVLSGIFLKILLENVNDLYKIHGLLHCNGICKISTPSHPYAPHIHSEIGIYLISIVFFFAKKYTFW